MEPLIIALHILVCLGIIGLILLQQGKGAEMGASFGSGGSQTLFGSAGSGNMLSHATAILVTIFFLTSFGLAVIAKQKATAGSEAGVPAAEVIDAHNAAQQQVPAVPQPAGDVPAVSNPAAPADVPAEPAKQ
jgi:preprotein translocase subunit SecG